MEDDLWWKTIYDVFVVSGKFGSGMILGAERLQVPGNGFEVDRVHLVYFIRNDL